MNCSDAFERLYEYLDRERENAKCEEIEKHLNACRECFDRFEFERLLIKRLKSSCCSEPPCSETLILRIKKIIQKF